MLEQSPPAPVKLKYHKKERKKCERVDSAIRLFTHGKVRKWLCICIGK